MTTTQPLITLEHLSKTYLVHTRAAGRRLPLRRDKREVAAVSDVSFTISRGEMVGYIGPNGAGKSTTIKMITGILTPTSGSVNVLGLTPTRQRRQLAGRIGVVFGHRSQLWYDLPLIDSFDLLHHLYRTDKALHHRNLDEFVDRLELGPFLDVPVRQLSLGQRMRGEVTAALLHDPALVVLDEPTIGLDVVSKYAVREFLGQVNGERGTTVLLTTHDLDDIEQLCPRMMVIDNGQVLLDGPVADFKATHGTDRTVVVDLTTAGQPLEVANAIVTRVDGPRQWLRFDRRETTAADVIAQISAVAPIRDLAIEEPEIEDLIRRLYQRPDPGGNAG